MKKILALCVLLVGCASGGPESNYAPIVGCGDICVGSENVQIEPPVIQVQMCSGDGTGN